VVVSVRPSVCLAGQGQGMAWQEWWCLINIEEKPYLKKNEVCLLSPNFKLAFK
jgi:hypothetical protein